MRFRHHLRASSIAAALTLAPAAQAVEFHREVLEAVVNPYTSIAVTADGQVALGFGRIGGARFLTSPWGDSEEVGGGGGAISIGFHDFDQPWAAVDFQARTFVEVRGPDGWMIDTILEHYQDAQLCVDANGAVHVGGIDSQGYNVEYATNASGVWETELVESLHENHYAHGAIAMALDSQGTPHIVYAAQDKVFLAWKDAGWNVEVLVEDVENANHVSIDLNSYDRFNITYFEPSTGRLIYLREGAFGTWLSEVVDGDLAAPAGRYSSVAVANSGVAHIAYVGDAADGTRELRHAFRAAAGWQIQVVDDQLEPGRNCSLAVDAHGNVHIAYPKEEVWQLWYARTYDCNANGIDDLNEGPDCDDDGILDSCRLALGFSQDCNANSIPDECEADCNANGVADECDIATGVLADCNQNGIADICDPTPDCDNNGVPDSCDIAAGTLEDCNGNGVADLCDPIVGDCNGNGVFDSCDIASGTSQNCNGNNLPDECEPDCNANGSPDDCDVYSGFSADCNRNNQPDECDVTNVLADCNVNGTPDVCDLAPLAELATTQSNARLGAAVSAAGDFDADGFDDVVVGAFQDGPGFTGRAYVYRGGPQADNVADFTLPGQMPNDAFGAAVAGGADFNGDGHADVVVGAPKNDQGPFDGGLVYVFYGGPAADTNPDVTLTVFDGPMAGLGTSVALIDLDNDGLADVAAGGPHDTARGKVHVFRGGPYPSGTQLQPAASYTGPGGNQDGFGIRVANAGDLDGDGREDLAAASTWGFYPDSGRVNVFFGQTGSLPASWSFSLLGESPGDQFGLGLGGAGDVDGDGFDDLVVGAPYADTTGQDGGRAYVYRGGNPPPTTPALVITPSVYSYRGNLGRSVDGSGDLNGDGYADIVIGEDERWIGGTGRAYVYFGGPTGIDPVLDRVLGGEQFGSGLGYAVAAAGDFNADQSPDFLVGAPWAQGTGQAHLLDAMASSMVDCNGNGAGDVCDIASGTSYDDNGNSIPDECEPTAIAPARLEAELLGAHPNPFNPTTTIELRLPPHAPVSLMIYDVRGRRVRTLLDGPTPGGRVEVRWDGRSQAGPRVASGTYFVRLRVGTAWFTTSVVLAK